MTTTRREGGPLILRGRTLSFVDDPFLVGPDEAVRHESDGAVLIEDGVIQAVGPAADILARGPSARIESHGDALLMAGFVDCHAHYPQTSVIASYGTQLLEWLEKYTFPAESRFADPEVAAKAAEAFLDECLRNGTTTACVYGTVHETSADAFFEAATARGLCMAAGKVAMDRHAPDTLVDTAQSAYDASKALIGRWHGKGRSHYVITPRFAPTSTPEQLEALGALWREAPDVLVQTHLSENRAEIAWVRELFPDCPDYLGVYERFGLLGPGAIFGHAIHLEDREIGLLRDSGSGIAHCPTSNTFIGSGLFDMKGLRDSADPLPVGLATDVGGGSSFSMFSTMRTAYEIAQLRGYALHPAKAFWLATVGSAEVMRLGGRIGNLAAGRDADIIALDLRSTPVIAQRVAAAEGLWEELFAQMILADDRAVSAVYVAGRRVV